MLYNFSPLNNQSKTMEKLHSFHFLPYDIYKAKKILILQLILLLSFQSLSQIPKFIREKDKDLLASIKEVSQNGWIKYNKGSIITAKNIFKENKAKFGLTDSDELRLFSEEADKTGRMHLRYKQYFKGIPVEGSDYTLHLVKGELDLSHGRVIEDFNFDVKEKLNEIKALEIAKQSINTKMFAWDNKEWETKLKEEKGDKNATFLPKGEIVIVKGDKEEFVKENYYLAWKFSIQTSTPKNKFIVYVDANTGKLIRLKEDKTSCFGSDKNEISEDSKLMKGERHLNIPSSNYSIFPKTNLLNNNFSNKKVTGPAPYCFGDAGHFFPLYTRYSGGQNNTYLDFKTNYRGFWHYDYALEDCRIHTKPWDSFWWFGIAGNLTDDNNWWENDKSITTAHWAFQRTWDYYYLEFNRWGGDDHGQGVHVWANCDNQNASYSHDWLWQYDEFEIGTGQNGVQGSYATLDVIGHEFTHAVTHHTAGLVYEKESGALNESFSDIFGTMVENYHLHNHNWTIAEDCGTIRNMQSNAVYNGTGWTNIANCTPSSNNDRCGVHSNSNVQNRFYSLLSDGGTMPVGPGTTVTAIGIDAASRIGYRALTSYMHENSNYADSREAWMNAARDLFGECSEQRKQVANAWSAVGIGSPITCTPSGGCNFNEGDFMFNWYGENVYAHRCGTKWYCTTDQGSGGYFKPKHWLEATGYANASCFEEDDPRPNGCTGGGGGTGGGSCTFSEGQYFFTFGATGEIVLAYHCNGVLYAKTNTNLFKPRHWLIAAGYDATLASCFAENNPGCGTSGRLSAVEVVNEKPETDSFKLLAFPNPALDKINITFFLENFTKVKLNLIDNKGMTVLAQPFDGIKGDNNTTIEISDLPSGVYILELQNGDKRSTQKIIKIQ